MFYMLLKADGRPHEGLDGAPNKFQIIMECITSLKADRRSHEALYIMDLLIYLKVDRRPHGGLCRTPVN